VTVLEAGSGFLREFDAVTGHTTQSYSLPKVMAMQVSPQQQQLLAFSSLRNVRFGDGLRNGKFEISVQGFESGVARTLLVSDYDQQCLPVGWWKQEIFVACSDASMRLPPLFLLDTLSETMKALDVNLRGIRHVRVRPDDGAIAISASTTNSSGSTFILKLPRRHSQNAPTSVMPQR
jgi:hypothetical protein